MRPPSGPAWLLIAQMQSFPIHGVFLNPDRQPKGSTRPISCVEREYGTRIGAWTRESIVLAHRRKNCSAVSGRSLKIRKVAVYKLRLTKLDWHGNRVRILNYGLHLGYEYPSVPMPTRLVGPGFTVLPD